MTLLLTMFDANDERWSQSRLPTAIYVTSGSLPGCPARVVVRFEVSSRGSATPVSVQVDSRPGGPQVVSSQILGRIPLKAMQAVVMALIAPRRPDAPRLALTRRRLDHDHVRKVADLYRAAIAEGRRDPCVYVANELEAVLPTARRWVQDARRAGVLEPAPAPGVKGLTAPDRPVSTGHGGVREFDVPGGTSWAMVVWTNEDPEETFVNPFLLMRSSRMHRSVCGSSTVERSVTDIL